MGSTTDSKYIPEEAVNTMIQIANEYGIEGKRIAIRYIPAKDAMVEPTFLLVPLEVKHVTPRLGAKEYLIEDKKDDQKLIRN